MSIYKINPIPPLKAPLLVKAKLAKWRNVQDSSPTIGVENHAQTADMFLIEKITLSETQNPALDVDTNISLDFEFTNIGTRIKEALKVVTLTNSTPQTGLATEQTLKIPVPADLLLLNPGASIFDVLNIVFNPDGTTTISRPDGYGAPIILEEVFTLQLNTEEIILTSASAAKMVLDITVDPQTGFTNYSLSTFSTLQSFSTNTGEVGVPFANKTASWLSPSSDSALTGLSIDQHPNQGWTFRDDTSGNRVIQNSNVNINAFTYAPETEVKYGYTIGGQLHIETPGDFALSLKTFIWDATKAQGPSANPLLWEKQAGVSLTIGAENFNIFMRADPTGPIADWSADYSYTSVASTRFTWFFVIDQANHRNSKFYLNGIEITNRAISADSMPTNDARISTGGGNQWAIRNESNSVTSIYDQMFKLSALSASEIADLHIDLVNSKS